jgi:HK97 family phage major capsid protein
MKLSKKLKAWTVEQKLAKADDSDDVFQKAVTGALLSGALNADQFADLSKNEEAGAVKSGLDKLTDVLDKVTSALEKDDKGKVPPQFAKEETEEEDEEEEGKVVPPPPKSKKPEGTKAALTDMEKMVLTLSHPMAVADGEEKSINVRVKEAADGYATTKTACVYPELNSRGAKHKSAGRPVMNYKDEGGRPMDVPSDQENAVIGAFAKFECNRVRFKSRRMGFETLPQHDKELLLFALENYKWSGCSAEQAKVDAKYADIIERKLSPKEQKALIDDATSGGTEAAPIVFDDKVIQTPLLNGELFPQVNQVPIDRGRRIEGVATGTVTGSWGGIDDTAITLFTTTSYVTAFDTTIHRWEGAIRIGLDFLSDTPIDFGAHITAQYGERLLEDLDDVIATGNGTTQPEGIMVKAGTTSVSFGGSTSLGSYESLRFGVAKPEHKGMSGSAVFCGSETSYQRAKAIPVGASDARRLSNTGNMPSYADYSWMGVPYKINESLGNTKIFYAILGRYRMYRRRGLTMRTSTEGDTLIRANEMLIVATARYGGQLERGAVAAVTSSAPA